jgi:cell migration-inducing and hyaluronan-binding protein
MDMVKHSIRLSLVACGLSTTLSCVIGDGDMKPLATLVTEEAMDYTIPAGKAFFIDKSYTVNNLVVNGKLFCRNDIVDPITITVRSITISGEGALFECGNESERYSGKITFKFIDDGIIMPPGHNHTAATATMSAVDGGTLRLFGDRVPNFGWQRIKADSLAGASTVQLERAVGWQVGDLVALGPSGFNFAEAEERTITAVANDGLSITVDKPFTYNHRAFTKQYSEGARTATLDERPEIANLSRNIVITTAGDVATLNQTQRGVGVVIRAGGSGFVDGVEIARGGKLGQLGEYPFHWHLAGDVPGQFLRNSTIHHSYQRCVTIHGSNYSEVSDNVCFDHLGHGYFFEQGNEVKNVMRNNLGMLSRRVALGKGLLDSDMRSDQELRFSAPSTFWITNPDNDTLGNVASGSQGTGFWMSFSNGIQCSGASCSGPGTANNVLPNKIATLRFSSNSAHASVVGINWDGAEDGEYSDVVVPGMRGIARKAISVHYSPPTEPTFDSLQVWKNVATGVYFRGTGGKFTNFLGADNGRTVFFAYDQSIKNGLVVGASEGVTAEDVDFGRRSNPVLFGFAGALIYDGPFNLQDVHFADFQTRFGIPAAPFYNIGGANRLVNRVSHITFDGPIESKVWLLGELTWSDTPWATALRDDGSISGIPGLLVPDHAMNISTGDCTLLNFAVVNHGYSCNYQMGVLTFSSSLFKPPYSAIQIPIKFERVEQANGIVVASDALPKSALTNKSAMIIGNRYRYRLSLSQPDAMLADPIPGRKETEHAIKWVWQPEVDTVSPVIEIDGLAGCRPSRAATQVGSLAELNTATTTAFRWEGSNLFMRLAPGDDEMICP